LENTATGEEKKKTQKKGVIEVLKTTHRGEFELKGTQPGQPPSEEKREGGYWDRTGRFIISHRKM